MRKNNCVFVGFRATKHERERVEALTKMTGLNVSALLRGLILNAEVTPAQFKTTLAQQTENGVTTLQGSHAIFQS